MIPDLLKRAVTVIIVGLILSGISSGEHLSRVLVFLVGIFPESGLLYLGKVARLSMQNGQNQARTTLFELTGMDLQAQQELSELGIASREELAVADWEQLLLSSGISPCLLLRAADEALLQVVAGRDLCLALTKVPIRRASELLASCAGLDPLSLDQAKADSLAQTLGHHDLRPVLTALSRNKNLARLPEIVHRYGLELPVPTAFTKPRMPATQPLSADMSVQVDR